MASIDRVTRMEHVTGEDVGRCHGNRIQHTDNLLAKQNKRNGSCSLIIECGQT